MTKTQMYRKAAEEIAQNNFYTCLTVKRLAKEGAMSWWKCPSVIEYEGIFGGDLTVLVDGASREEGFLDSKFQQHLRVMLLLFAAEFSRTEAA